jgi:Cullin family
MLAKLKVECGVQFTQKMEGMFNDMKVSADATRDYHEKITVCVELYVTFDSRLTPHVQGSS